MRRFRKPDPSSRIAHLEESSSTERTPQTDASTTQAPLSDRVGASTVHQALFGDGLEALGPIARLDVTLELAGVPEPMRLLTGSMARLESAREFIVGADDPGSGPMLLSLLRHAYGEVPEPIYTRVAALLGGGHPLPKADQARFSAAMDHDFSHVRIHTGAQAAQAAAALSAHAFAVGTDIFFGPGQFAPGSSQGDRLLAHELTHVIQHDDGRVPSGHGVSRPSDPIEQEAYANEGRVLARLATDCQAMRPPTADSGIDVPAPEAPQAAPVLRSVERDDEVRVSETDIPPEERMTLHGSTRRFAALMHIYESGDFGEGGLTAQTVVAENGMTLEAVYNAYREGRIGCTNSVLNTRRAQELVESIRRSGWVADAETARRAGIDPDDGGFDGISQLRLLPAGERSTEHSIDETLGFERGIRHFVENGHVSETRTERRDRTHREYRLEQLEHHGEGNWTHRDGQPLNEEEQAQLRRDLADNARGRGVLRGSALEEYQEHVRNPENPAIDAETWVRQQRASRPTQPQSPTADAPHPTGTTSSTEATEPGADAESGGSTAARPPLRRTELPHSADEMREQLHRRMCGISIIELGHPAM
ncbi:MAG: DUF4157 domain-containing protein, partial [Myxococcota bacterium]